MKNFSLNAEQKMLVEKNLGVVRFAIHKNIIVNDNLFGFEYDDLYQEGCIWLCKAALSYNEARDVKFATYAEKVVSNGLRTYCRLMCGKQKHQISVPAQTEPDTDVFSLEQIPPEVSLNNRIFCCFCKTVSVNIPVPHVLASRRLSGRSRVCPAPRLPKCTASGPILSAHGSPGQPKGSGKTEALCSISEELLKMTAPKS